MKTLLSTLMAVAISAQPLMLQAAQAPANAPAKPKVAGTSQAVSSGVNMENVEMGLLVGGVVVAVAAGASGGGNSSKHHDCHCQGGGGTTGTTGTTH